MLVAATPVLLVPFQRFEHPLGRLLSSKLMRILSAFPSLRKQIATTRFSHPSRIRIPGNVVAFSDVRTIAHRTTQHHRDFQMYFLSILPFGPICQQTSFLAVRLLCLSRLSLHIICSTHAAMIRLPPTTIVLGRSDLREFERRRQRRREVEILNEEFSRFAVGGPKGPAFAPLQSQRTQGIAVEVGPRKLQTRDEQVTDDQDRPLALQTSILHGPVRIAPTLEHDEYEAPRSPKSSNTTVDECPTGTDLEDGHDYVTIGSENPARDLQWSPASSKDDFYYGGFVESPTDRPSKNTQDRSSSFGMLRFSENNSPLIYCAAPADISTPQNIRLPDTNRLRNTIPLPRSPLFLSQNASSSPEHRPTTGLTPRVESSVAVHNTPGIMFAQPARRMRRPPPRTFRHQTNSFSFDSSERASAAYEQERVASTSTTGSTPRPSGDLSLHEELRGSSLQSSRVTSRTSHALPEPWVEELSTIRIRDESAEAASNLKDFLFSSPQLSLPPPFSAVSRSVSGVDTLPGVEYTPQNPETSPIRSSSNTPVRSGVEGRHPTPNSSPSGLEHVSEIDSSPPVRWPLQPPGQS
jgi:hypothetical protein